MGWFSGLGHALSKGVGAVDRVISGNNITSLLTDPLRGPSQKITSDIFGKNAIPTKLYGKITNHPLESAATAAAIYYGGGALLGGGLGSGAADVGAGAADATAMGGAAGTLGAADSAAASADLGLTAADLGGGTADVAGLSALDSAAAASDAASVSPGGGADLLMGGGGVDSPAFQAGQYVGQDLAAPTTSSGFGGVGTDPSVSTLSDSGPSYWQQAKDALGINPATGGSAMQTALNVASKYGPLGLSLMRAAMSKNAENRAAAQIGSTGQLQRQTASGLVTGYNNGTLNPAESASIDQWAQQQTAALRQFYANAGTGDSTQAQQAIAAIQQKAVEMKAQARQNLLQTGLSELNGLDQNTIKAIQLNLQGDQAASKAEADFSQEFFKLLAGSGGMNKTAGP